MKEEIMSSVLDMGSLGCFSDFQVEKLKKALELQVCISGQRFRLEIYT